MGSEYREENDMTTKTLILGDVQGANEAADDLIRSLMAEHPIDQIIQVGDMGFCYPGYNPWTTDYGVPQKWIDGNHENFDLLHKRHIPNFGEDPYHSMAPLGWRKFLDLWEYKPRGTIENGVLYIGGAMSPPWFISDAQEGVEWWSQEQITEKDYLIALENIESYEGGPDKIHTVISHDCPTSFSMDEMLGGPSWSSKTRFFLEEIRILTLPERWYFGHYHFQYEGVFEGCNWRCLNEIKWNRKIEDQDYIIVDLPDKNGYPPVI